MAADSTAEGSTRKRGRGASTPTTTNTDTHSVSTSEDGSEERSPINKGGSNNNNSNNNQGPCQGTRKDGSACNRKAKGDCAHGRCVACCEKLAQPCAAHEALIRKRQEEEALLAQPLTLLRGASSGDASAAASVGEDGLLNMRLHPAGAREASFDAIGDTVVLFSLRDFLRNKKWSKDAVEQGLRRRRGRRGIGRTVSGGERPLMSKRALGKALAQRKAEKGQRKLAALSAKVVAGEG